MSKRSPIPLIEEGPLAQYVIGVEHPVGGFRYEIHALSYVRSSRFETPGYGVKVSNDPGEWIKWSSRQAVHRWFQRHGIEALMIPGCKPFRIGTQPRFEPSTTPTKSLRTPKPKRKRR